MRTFIFTKGKRTESGKIVVMIVGMIHSNMYPSSEIAEGGEYYGCQCHEVPEGHCHIEIGTFRESLPF